MILGIAGLLAGAALVGWGLSEARGAKWAKALPLIRAADARPGATAFVEGLAVSPAHLAAPATGRDCVFYESVTRRDTIDEPTGWDPDGVSMSRQRQTQRHGAFLIRDATGEVFIFPGKAYLSISDDAVRSTAATAAHELDVAVMERVIEPNRLVCAAGTFRTAAQALDYLRTHSGEDSPREVIEELQRRAESTGALCMVGTGGFWVADRSRAELVASLSGSADLLISCGGCMAVLGGAALAAALLGYL